MDRHPRPGARPAGMTLIEIICALLILGLLSVLGTRLLENFVRGYTMARNSDATVQKAQNALQRMTLEFTYLNMANASGTASGITYTTNLDSGVTIRILQSGNTIVYQRGGTNYVLTDGVASGSLAFSYYTTYSGAAVTTATNNSQINMIGFSYNMVGSDTSQNFSQTYSTRVKVNKVQ